MKQFTYVILTFICTCYCSGSTLAQPPIQNFTNYAEYEELKISPKGTYLAFTQNSDNQEYLHFIRIDDLSFVSKISFGSNTSVASFDWVNDERILMAPSRSANGMFDFKQPTGEIFGINADGSNLDVLFGFMAGSRSTGRIKGRVAMGVAGDIVDLLPDDPDHVIIQSIGYGIDGEFNQSWNMNVNSGRLIELKKSPIRNGQFITDHHHEIRYVVGGDTDNTGKLYFLNESNDWELIIDGDAENWVTPLSSLDDGAMLVQNLSEEGFLGISQWDTETKRKTSLFHHDNVDISGVFYDNKNTVWAVEYIDHYTDYYYPDPAHPLAVLHQQLRAELPSQRVKIIDETDDLSKVLVYISSPQNPGEYLLMDTNKKQFLMRLSKYPDFPVEQLSRVDPVQFMARDGLEIRAYLTMPLNRPEQHLPMVVLPHGGPYEIYDEWDYNYEAQLLASRGYLVFQVNFRGSGGRGKDYLEAGYGEWGGKMQDDITDAVHWAINDGVADPDRICIYGGSYGGYAALTGAYQEPDLFKCVIGMSGIYDLNLMFEKGDIAKSMRGQSYLDEVLGGDISLLASRSPVENASLIKADVMLIHGKMDERAPFEHAKRMRKALEDASKDVEWLVESRESHGIMSEENRIRAYEGILVFLEKNIGH